MNDLQHGREVHGLVADDEAPAGLRVLHRNYVRIGHVSACSTYIDTYIRTSQEEYHITNNNHIFHTLHPK